MKRVITGINKDGKSIISKVDEGHFLPVTDAVPDWYAVELWNTHKMPLDENDDDGIEPDNIKLPPPVNGTAFRLVQFPPEKDMLANLDTDKSMAETMNEYSDESVTNDTSQKVNPMMHKTPSVDYGIVIEGNITMIMEEEEVDLEQGDVVIQRATEHAFSNRSDKPVKMLFVLVDARS